MKLTIVSGSQRANSQSLNVARFLKQHGLQEFDQVEILDLHELNLPFWNEGVWQGSQEWDVWTPIAQKLKESDAFVFITPEWHGMKSWKRKSVHSAICLTLRYRRLWCGQSLEYSSKSIQSGRAHV